MFVCAKPACAGLDTKTEQRQLAFVVAFFLASGCLAGRAKHLESWSWEAEGCKLGATELRAGWYYKSSNRAAGSRAALFPENLLLLQPDTLKTCLQCLTWSLAECSLGPNEGAGTA